MLDAKTIKRIFIRNTNISIQIILALIFFAEGIIISFNGVWWSVYGQKTTPAIELLVRGMGVGLLIYSIFYAVFIMQDITGKKSKQKHKA